MMNSENQYLDGFWKALKEENIIEHEQKMEYLSSLPVVMVAADLWEKAAQIAIAHKARFAGLWAQDLGQQMQVMACFEVAGKHFVMCTHIDSTVPKLGSIMKYYPAANRFERHAHDLLGIKFSSSPDQRRWTRHKAWEDNQFPLRDNFSSSVHPSSLTPPDLDYPFIQAKGEGIYEIPVGPVHAGIIEPGHFRFQVAGEDVINLEEHLGYVHRGIEKVAQGRDVNSLVKLAGRISGDSTVAHAWAAARACENAHGVTISERAAFIRAILAERERIANHLGDMAAICNDVGFSFAYFQLMRLKEDWLRTNAKIFGHRLLMDIITFGGVALDLSLDACDAMRLEIKQVKKELEELYVIMEENSSLHDRLKTTGVLNQETAEFLGALGYVGRASGCNFDLRRDAPYSPYDKLEVYVPVHTYGDVLARTRIRAQEILVSLGLLNELFAKLPEGEIQISSKLQVESRKGAVGIGLIEGWRGEILTYVSFDDAGLVNRFFPRDPSWFSWPALEILIHGNIVPDFPVCNKSINGSYAGVDL